MQIEWVPYPTDERYMISSVGEVYSLISNKLLSPVQVKNYLKIEVGGKLKFIHNLVLEAFVGPRPEGQVCRHLNGQTWDNNVSNLQWGTQEENVQDSRDHGTFRKLTGSECHQAKLTDKQVVEIRRSYFMGDVSQSRLGRKYGISQGRVSSIVNFQSYKTTRETDDAIGTRLGKSSRLRRRSRGR